MRYKKKPIEVEAILYNGTGESFKEVDSFTNGKLFLEYNKPFIDTLEGKMFLSVGDYVIKGVKGEFYPCKPDIFTETYERID